MSKMWKSILVVLALQFSVTTVSAVMNKVDHVINVLGKKEARFICKNQKGSKS
jgi:hypothetical protein